MAYFGVLDDNNENHMHLNVASKLVEEVIADCIPFIEKTAYLEALEKSPHLIVIETNPIWFLTFEKWNIWSAAQRIVKYWEWKRTFFGDVRTFLPIHDLSGNGALSELDIQAILLGYIAILPKDERGNFFLFLNNSRAGEPRPWDSDVSIRLRVFFYQFCDILGKYYHDRHHFDYESGVIVLSIVETLMPNPTVNLRDMIAEAMPVRILRVHNIFYRTKSNASFMEKYIIEPSFLAVNAMLLKFTNHTMHYCSSPNEAMMKLEQNAVPAYCIPTELGGTWSDELLTDLFQESSDDVLEFIEQHPISLQQITSEGDYPLHYACYNCQIGTDVVMKLIETFQMAVRKPNYGGNYPLHLACLFNQPENVIMKLIEIFPEAANHSLNDSNSSALHLACCSFNFKSSSASETVISSLIELNPTSLHMRDKLGRTPLHVACGFGNDYVVEILLQYPGIDVNSKLTDGNATALHIASSQSFVSVVQKLLCHPCIMIDETDNHNKTPLKAMNRRIKRLQTRHEGSNNQKLSDYLVIKKLLEDFPVKRKWQAFIYLLSHVEEL